MKSIYFCTLLFVFFSISLFANPHKLFDEANKLYTSEKYAEALKNYKELTNLGYISSELYFNIGNTYYKMDSLASSILWYERAKLLNPADKSIDANLKIANSRTIDKIEPLPKMLISTVWTKLLGYFSLNIWSMIVISLSLITSLLFFLYFKSNTIFVKKLFFFSGILSFLSFLLVLYFALQALKLNDKTHLKKAIVFSEYVNVKSTPSESGVNLFVLHEGTSVYIKQELNGWLNVSIENGNEGWMQKTEVRNI